MEIDEKVCKDSSRLKVQWVYNSRCVFWFLLQPFLFRNNGRAREAKPGCSQLLQSLSERWALRMSRLCVHRPSVEPAACSWPCWLPLTPWLLRLSLAFLTFWQLFNYLFSLLLRDSQMCWNMGVGAVTLGSLLHLEWLITSYWQIYLTIFDKWVVWDSLMEEIICNFNLKGWASESRDYVSVCIKRSLIA